MKQWFALIFLVLLFSCSKDEITTDSNARLAYNGNSVDFDTVFTQAGTATKIYTIANPNNSAIRIGAIKVLGTNSPFKINVNGQAGPVVNNLLINAKDSIYIFVTAHINPNDSLQPFLAKDSLGIIYNGNEDKVYLNAYGQNALYINADTITNNTTWDNLLPYVVGKPLTVAENATLTIEAGTKIYLHAGATINVNGTLIANGIKEKPVVFKGDRIDEPYKNYPGGWGGIVFAQNSQNNNMLFANILNATNAITLHGPSVNSLSKLKMQQCIIDNALKSGIGAINSSLEVNNCLVSNSGEAVKILAGGVYQFTNVTFATYSTQYVYHTLPSIYLSNTFDDNGTIVNSPLNAAFTNAILWGDLENELSVEKNNAAGFGVQLTNCIYKAATEPANINFLNSAPNQDPRFDSVDVNRGIYDFRITKDIFSPAIDAGMQTMYAKDLDDKPRMVNLTDIGCFEKQD